MSRGTKTRALRDGLLQALAGFACLAVSVAIWLVVTFYPLDVAVLVARVVGLVGAGLFGLALIAFRRAPSSYRAPPSLDVALVLWFVEFALRAGTLVAPDRVAAAAWFVPVRVGLLAAAVIALATGMRGIWGGRGSSRLLASWGATRVAFLLQLGLIVLVVTVPGATFADQLPERVRQVATWLAFALPWAVLWMALRRTLLEVARRDTVAEILTH